MARQFVLILIPCKLLAHKAQAVLGENSHTTIEFPYSELVEIISRVALYITVDMKLVVELLQEYAFVKNPLRRMLVDIHLPSLSNNAILDDARIADECVDTIRSHHCHGVACPDGRSCMLHLLLTCSHQQESDKSIYNMPCSIH